MTKRHKICIALGIRPEIIKLSPIIKELKIKKTNYFTVFSGQHFSKNMSSIFFNELGYNKIKYNLKNKKPNNSLSFIKNFYFNFFLILKKEKPSILIVQE
jgi:UDP-N-acetylglucosamine 2-epimerase (non-hydrolysing)